MTPATDRQPADPSPDELYEERRELADAWFEEIRWSEWLACLEEEEAYDRAR